MKREMLIAAFVSLSAGGITLAAAQGDPKTLGTESAKMDSLATSQGNLKVESRIGSDFNAFAGSTANSSSLVSGLRTGSDITLSSTDAKGVVTTTTFTPPTGKMGYGNVYTSLALAKHQLAGIGITQPTAQELQAAMIGGNVTTIGPNGQTTTTALTGVLTLRSQGMGWGQIAQTYGTKLGPVISGMKAANAHVSTLPAATTKAAPAGGVTTASGASSGGVTTAAGGSSHGHGNAYGRGVTTAGGGAAGQGNGNAYGRGITTGAGGTPGNSGNAGQARGAGKGG